MSDNERIMSALTLLENAANEPSSEPPAVVVMPPDSGDFIVGNAGGFIQLAIASLKAAQGEEQLFKKQSWATVSDFDWGIAGLKPDPSAHIYLPKTRTKSARHLGSIAGFLLLFAVLMCLGVGAYTIFRFVFH